MSEPRRRPRRSRRPPPFRNAGYFILEALCGLAVLGTGLLPLALLSRPASAWAREQRALSEAVATAAEAAELAGLRICGRPDARVDPACPPDRAHEISMPMPGGDGPGGTGLRVGRAGVPRLALPAPSLLALRIAP